MDIELLGIMIGVVLVGGFLIHFPLRNIGKLTAKDAAELRDAGYRDWILRGGTADGWNDQNSLLTTAKHNWKPNKR